MKKEQSVRRRILLVDDDRVILATLSQGLQQAGYDILQAISAAEALKVIETHQPDLAVLDVRMPNMSGIELARHLSDHTPIPFMFLSACSNVELARQAAQYGAVGFLVKPIDTTQIIPALEAALARADEIKTLRRNEADLANALAAGREVSIAVGVLIERHKMSRESAFENLRLYARTHQRKLSEVALELIEAAEVLNVIQAGTPKT